MDEVNLFMHMLNELDTMRADAMSARSTFQPDPVIWSRINGEFRGLLQSQGVGDVLTQRFNPNFASWVPSDQRYSRFVNHMAPGASPSGSDDWYKLALQFGTMKVRERCLAAGLNDLTRIVKAPESGASRTIDDGLMTTWDIVLSIDTVASLVRAVPDLLMTPKIVVDLGAGWGRLGHVLKQLNPQITYVDADLPESLVVAQEYLPRQLPNEKVFPHSHSRNTQCFTRDDLITSGGLHFMGAHLLERFADASIDVFINVYSFQEMTHDQTREYLQLIDRIAKGGVFHTRQRLVTHNDYRYPTTWNCLNDQTEFFSPHYFEATYQVI